MQSKEQFNCLHVGLLSFNSRPRTAWCSLQLHALYLSMFPLLHPSSGHGATRHVLSFQYCGFYVRVTNAITCDRFLWSASLHHSLRWNRNNVKTLINDGQRNWPLQQSLLQCNQSHMTNCIPSLITSAWRAKIALILDPIPDPRQVLIVTSAPDQNNLLNSTTLTLFFTVRSTRPHILEIYN